MLASLLITEKCNFRCTYCFERDHAIRRDMDDGVLDRLPGFVMTNHIDGINFFGGEPFLVFDKIKKIIAGLDKENLKVKYSITTNGSLIGSEHIDFIKDNNINIIFSFDGIQPRQDKCRKNTQGDGTFSLLESRMPLLVELSESTNRVSVRVTVSPDNILSLADSIAYIVDVGFKRIVLSPDYCTDWSEAQLNAYDNELVKIQDIYIHSPKPFSFELFEKYVRANIYKQKTPWTCYAGLNKCAIDVEGNLYPCHRFVHLDKKFSYGDIFHDISFDARKAFLESMKVINKDCMNCMLENRCHSSCYAINYDTTGNCNIPASTTCEIEKMHIRQADQMSGKLYIKNKGKFNSVFLNRYVANDTANQ